MKTLALVMLATSFLASNPNGCGAAIGSDQGKGPSGVGEGPVDAGSLPRMTCGALGTHVFCDGFDGALPSAFDGETIYEGALALDTTQFASPPQSLLATLLHETNTTRTYAQLQKAFGFSGHRFVLGFSERVDPGCVGAWDSVQTGVIVLRQNTYFLSLEHGAANDSIAETSLSGGVYVQSHILDRQTPRGAWTRVVLDCDIAKGTIDVSVDGAPVMQGEPLTYGPSSPQPPGIQAGVLIDNGTFEPSACDVGIDDVTFDVEP